jgi:hypothetical protein
VERERLLVRAYGGVGYLAYLAIVGARREDNPLAYVLVSTAYGDVVGDKSRGRSRRVRFNELDRIEVVANRDPKLLPGTPLNSDSNTLLLLFLLYDTSASANLDALLLALFSRMHWHDSLQKEVCTSALVHRNSSIVVDVGVKLRA